MSLRRSARVQASVLSSDIMKDGSLKQAFALTKPRSGIATLPKKNLKSHQDTQTRKKRRKLETKDDQSANPVTVDSSSLPPGYSTGDIDDAIPSDRPVEPHITNAPLESPRDGHVVTAYSNFESTPSTTNTPAPSTTISTVLDQAIAHLLSVDKTGRLKPVIDKHHCHVFSPAGLAEPIDPFRSLSSGIMAQQVSGAAASSIKNKFIALFPSCAPAFPSPELVVATPIPTLRSAGLSQRKAEYIQGLAEKFVSGELGLDMLVGASDEEVMERLVAVRGLGRWSVEMFACFGLKRLDVFSTGDLGVQ